MSLNSEDTYQFITYACPTGKLNSQIETYLAKSRVLYGENSAHKYMPHCTLTGFFAARSLSIPTYIKALNKAYIAAQNDKFSLEIDIKQLTFRKNWHGLELQNNSLKQLIANFAKDRTIVDYPEKLRLKDWLHLSLAYNFNPEHEQ